MRCVDCEYLKRIQKPIRFGKDIFDTGMVECTKHDLIMEYTSTKALNKRTCVEDEPQTEDDLLLELMDAVERGEMSDAGANQAYVEYISKRVEESDTPQTERKNCKLELFDDDGNYIKPQMEEGKF